MKIYMLGKIKAISTDFNPILAHSFHQHFQWKTLSKIT